MAKVFKCDICGGYYPYPKNIKEINRLKFENVGFLGPEEIEYFDICPDCVDVIKKVIEERMDQSLKEE